MNTTFRLASTFSALLMLTAPLSAQQAPDDSKGTGASGGTSDRPAAAAPVEKTDEEKAAEEPRSPGWKAGR